LRGVDAADDLDAINKTSMAMYHGDIIHGPCRMRRKRKYWGILESRSAGMRSL
jgi:hypothetical protein